MYNQRVFIVFCKHTMSVESAERRCINIQYGRERAEKIKHKYFKEHRQGRAVWVCVNRAHSHTTHINPTYRINCAAVWDSSPRWTSYGKQTQHTIQAQTQSIADKQVGSHSHSKEHCGLLALVQKRARNNTAMRVDEVVCVCIACWHVSALHNNSWYAAWLPIETLFH